MLVHGGGGRWGRQTAACRHTRRARRPPATPLLPTPPRCAALGTCCSRVTFSGAGGATPSCDATNGLVLKVASGIQDVDASFTVAAAAGNSLSFAGDAGAPDWTCEAAARAIVWDSLPTPFTPSSSGAAKIKIAKPSDGSCPSQSCAGARVPGNAFLAANERHACAVQQDGTVSCSGFNQYGQIGGADFSQQSSPVQVSGVAAARGVAAGVRHSCALLGTGRVACWVSGSRGARAGGRGGWGGWVG